MEKECMKGLEASLQDNFVILKWKWDPDWVKADVVFSWKCDDSFDNRSNWVTADIQRAEYYEYGSMFRYNIEPSDFGILSFKIIPYKYTSAGLEAILFIDGNTVQILSKSQDVFYEIVYKKDILSEYKYAYICLKCGADIKKEALYYKKNGLPFVYCFPSEIKRGSNRLGPVIVKKNETIVLALREEYRGYYRLKES